jgi:hypothetical protein
MLFELDHKERGGELYLKVADNFVDGPQLFQRLCSQSEHMIFFIERLE